MNTIEVRSLAVNLIHNVQVMMINLPMILIMTTVTLTPITIGITSVDDPLSSVGVTELPIVCI